MKLSTCLGSGAVDENFWPVKDSAVEHNVPASEMAGALWCKACERFSEANDHRAMIKANLRDLEAMGETIGYTLAELRDGTGFDKGARFVQI